MKKLLSLTAALAVMLLVVACPSTGGATAASSGEPVVIKLEAKTAELVTNAQLVYEEGPDRDNIGWWTKTDDEIKWNLEIKEAGDYTVTVRVACDPQFPGSEVGVTVNNKTFTLVVPDTNNWAEYQVLTIGKIQLAPGTYPVVVKAIKVANRFVANLNNVTFQK